MKKYGKQEQEVLAAAAIAAVVLTSVNSNRTSSLESFESTPPMVEGKPNETDNESKILLDPNSQNESNPSKDTLPQISEESQENQGYSETARESELKDLDENIDQSLVPPPPPPPIDFDLDQNVDQNVDQKADPIDIKPSAKSIEKKKQKKYVRDASSLYNHWLVNSRTKFTDPKVLNNYKLFF